MRVEVWWAKTTRRIMVAQGKWRMLLNHLLSHTSNKIVSTPITHNQQFFFCVSLVFCILLNHGTHEIVYRIHQITLLFTQCSRAKYFAYTDTAGHFTARHCPYICATSSTWRTTSATVPAETEYCRWVERLFQECIPVDSSHRPSSLKNTLQMFFLPGYAKDLQSDANTKSPVSFSTQNSIISNHLETFLCIP